MVWVLTEINFRNFQSLQKVDLELGNFTVIVGPSSSGKSAVIRALKVLNGNARTASFITHGALKSVIRASSPQGQVTYSRSASSSSYSVALPGSEPQAYTKLAGTVPEAVRALLGLDPDLAFAGQFDKPYLLDSSGGEIAKTLGELTNVSIIFEAAKESNRRKLLANATLKIRQQDFDQIILKLSEFKDLKSRIEKLNEAEKLISDTGEVNERISRLTSLICVIEDSERLLISLPDEKDIPVMGVIETAQGRLKRFQELLLTISVKKGNEYTYGQMDIEIDSELRRLELELHDLLVDKGICPLCNQSTVDL